MMPRKDPKARLAYTRSWKRRARAGLPTRTTPVLSAAERLERKHASNRQWEAANPDKVRAKRKRWNELNVDEKREHNLLKRYGITLAEFEARLIAQGSACALCRKPLDLNRTRSIHVDHIHGTKIIRGIIHGKCNVGIGNLGDDVEGLTRALIYVSGATAPERVIDEHW